MSNSNHTPISHINKVIKHITIYSNVMHEWFSQIFSISCHCYEMYYKMCYWSNCLNDFSNFLEWPWKIFLSVSNSNPGPISHIKRYKAYYHMSSMSDFHRKTYKVLVLHYEMHYEIKFAWMSSKNWVKVSFKVIT